MAKTKQLTLGLLREIVATYVAANKLAGDFEATVTNTAGLVDKIGKIFTIEQKFIDKLNLFDGENLDYGRTVEEWAQHLVLPVADSDLADVDAITSAYQNYAPASYSYELGDMVFKITKKYSDLQKAVNNAEQLTELVTGILTSINNSVMVYKYNIKRQLLGRFADAAVAAQDATDASAWDKDTARTVGAKVKNADGSKVGIVVKPYATTAQVTSYDLAVSGGYVVTYDLVTEIAKPVDNSTGEAFITAAKKDVETALDESEGHSLNGNTLGTNEGLTLIMLQGINPELQVKVEAGAFNQDKITVPAQVITVPNFGNMTATGVYALLVDNRAVRAFPSFDMFDDIKGKGFINYFRTLNYTCHYSRNAFIRVYREPQE